MSDKEFVPTIHRNQVRKQRTKLKTVQNTWIDKMLNISTQKGN